MPNSLRWGTVRKSDINDRGEIRPDAPILGFYKSLYDQSFDSDAVERWGRPFRYNGGKPSGNVRVDKVSVPASDALGRLTIGPFDDVKSYETLGTFSPSKRGASALGYVRGRDKDLITGTGGENGKYNVQILTPTGNFDDRKDVYALADRMLDMKRKSKYMRGSDANKTLSVPYIITANDSDYVDYEDMLKGGYDFKRDYLQERNLKGWNVQRLPDGLIKIETSPLDYNENKKARESLENIIAMLSKASSRVINASVFPKEKLVNFVDDIGKKIDGVSQIADKLGFGESINHSKLCLDDTKNTIYEMYEALDKERSKPFSWFDDEEDDSRTGEFEAKKEKVKELLGHTLEDVSYIKDVVDNTEDNGRIIYTDLPTDVVGMINTLGNVYNINDSQNTSDYRLKDIKWPVASKPHANYMAYNYAKELYNKGLKDSMCLGIRRPL